jgi:BA14K-like protein
MTRTTMKVAAMVGLSALSLSGPAEAGHGWGTGWGTGWGDRWHGGWGWYGPGYWGAGLIGFGVGAAVGAALTAPAYVGPPPPIAYGPVAGAYGPPAWTPAWYTYCAQRYRSFNSHTGYFTGYDGQPYFCQ